MFSAFASGYFKSVAFTDLHTISEMFSLLSVPEYSGYRVERDRDWAQYRRENLAARREAERRYAAKNAPRRREAAKTYRETHQEAISARVAAWKAANVERCRAHRKKYREKQKVKSA